MRCDKYTVEMVNALPVWDKKTKSHPKYDWSISYIALGDSSGLNPELFDLAMSIAKAQKMSLVNYLIAKPVFGKQNQIHTKESATAVADAQFKFKYENELRAFAMPTISNYWTREAGGIEFGELEVDKISRLDEVTTEITSNKREWTPAARQKRIVGQMLVYLARGIEPRKVIRNCRNLKRMFAITAEQFDHIVNVAGGIHMEAIKQTQVAL